MSKNKTYILISILTLICFLATAALCNQFGGIEEENEPPTLKLQISYGPVLSDEDGTCYYEVEATATGTPEPDIEFTIDDNVSLLTAEKVKIVLEDAGDTYTLEAKATNPEGSTTASINLSWGCEGEVAIEEELEDAEGEVIEEDITEEETPEENQQQENQGQVSEGDLFPPELSISIYEGPLYSAADDVCYYRIEAELYGNPYPELTWSKDDSNHTLGWDKAQVNLKRGESYTLIATATNSESTVTRELPLSWGCDEEDNGNNDEDAIGENSSVEDTEEASLGFQDVIAKMPVVPSETGTFGTFFDSALITVGDNNTNINMQGFMSFDISSLKDTQVQEVKLVLPIDKILGDLSIFNNLYAGVCYWGEGKPTQDSLNKQVTMIIFTKSPAWLNENSSLVAQHTVQNTGLVGDLQNSINNGKVRYKFKLYFSGVLTDNDSNFDLIDFDPESIILEVKYMK